MKNLLFVGPNLSFSRNDYNELNKKFSVTLFEVKYYKNIFKYFSLIFKIRHSEVVYIWFASLLSAYIIFFCKLFKIKVILVAGGYDTAEDKDIGYGAMLHPIKKFFYIYSFNNADLVLPVSKYTRTELLTNSKPKKIKLLYNGIDVLKFSQGKYIKKNIVLTVVSNLDYLVMKKKGIDTFARCSKILNNVHFYIVGRIDKKIQKFLENLGSTNLYFLGYRNYRDLLYYYRISKVYAQLSKHESFGCALAESMLCECVPVVTPLSALPEIVGNTGFYVNYGDIDGTVKTIKNALSSPKGKSARKRIIDLYSLSVREKKLTNLFKAI